MNNTVEFRRQSGVKDDLLKNPAVRDLLRKAGYGLVPDLLACLSQQQYRVFQLLLQDKTTKAMAHEMGITLKTFTVHQNLVHRKLGVNSRTGLILFAVNNGLLTPQPNAELTNSA